jgi:hypothetical protein
MRLNLVVVAAIVVLAVAVVIARLKARHLCRVYHQSHARALLARRRRRVGVFSIP